MNEQEREERLASYRRIPIPPDLSWMVDMSRSKSCPHCNGTGRARKDYEPFDPDASLPRMPISTQMIKVKLRRSKDEHHRVPRVQTEDEGDS